MSSFLSVVENSVPVAKPSDSSTGGAEGSSSSLDFIGSSHAVKHLFALPYGTDRPISVAVHNIGGTLLIDGDHEQELPSKPAASNKAAATRPLPKKDDDDPSQGGEHSTESRSLVALSSLELDSEALTLVHKVIESSRTLHPPSAPTPGPLPPTPEPREYLNWKFHDMNLLVGSDAIIYRSPDTALTVRVEEADDMQRLLQQHTAMRQSGQFLPDHQYNQRQQVGKPSYAEATRRRLKASAAEDVSSSIENVQGSFAAPDLDQVRLQTCIVPAQGSPIGGLFASGPNQALQTVDQAGPKQPSPVSAVLDIYLDNIMANVPQLALCLKEKGFIQSVKLLQTDEIPSSLMHPSTLDTSTPFSVVGKNAEAEQIFSPQIMETNASTLLRFLKTNCTRDNATYLLRREAGQANIQLYDVSAISTQGQRKWIWWLAMMSYRFANRLRHMSTSVGDAALRRNCRTRQRSLLQNTLDLLEVLNDIDGNRHESLVAAVAENLADTFLAVEDDELPQSGSSSMPAPATSVSTQQPYASISVDALTKAQDHLTAGIKGLMPLLYKQINRARARRNEAARPKENAPVTVVSIRNEDTGSDYSDDEDEASDGSGNEATARLSSAFRGRIDPIVTQLFGMHHKFVNVSLRLAEIHLRNYYSSSAMQALRASARRIADSVYLFQLLESSDERRAEWLQWLQLQYTWLWEHCGHFARSFAADELWRDRGHASGDDIISVLRDAEGAFLNHADLLEESDAVTSRFVRPESRLSIASKGSVSLDSLSGVVLFHDDAVKGKGTAENSLTEANRRTAEEVLNTQTVILRDKRRVLVAACICYSRAIQSFRDMPPQATDFSTMSGSALLTLLQQRLGDACNETGKILLQELRGLLTDPATDQNDKSLARVADALLSSAQFWFSEGLATFEACKDLRNIALLRCNLCQSYKLRANSVFSAFSPAKASLGGSDGPVHAELCLQEAANHLQKAHESLAVRDVDPVTWDMVSKELAATFLVLGVRRRESLIGSGNLPLIMHALRLSPGKEHSIVDPIERALKIYEEVGNRHQAAAAHYQLALFYSKVWTIQRSEAKTREKLSAAFSHYKAAHVFFSRNVRGNEVTFCLLCLDLSSLYAALSSEFECTEKAVACCLDALATFDSTVVQGWAVKESKARSEWFSKMSDLATSLEERIFKLLRTLVKLEEDLTVRAVSYKETYRSALQAKCGARLMAKRWRSVVAMSQSMRRRGNFLICTGYWRLSVLNSNRRAPMQTPDAVIQQCKLCSSCVITCVISRLRLLEFLARRCRRNHPRRLSRRRGHRAQEGHPLLLKMSSTLRPRADRCRNW